MLSIAETAKGRAALVLIWRSTALQNRPHSGINQGGWRKAEFLPLARLVLTDLKKSKIEQHRKLGKSRVFWRACRCEASRGKAAGQTFRMLMFSLLPW
jgi:hypothetical protein